MSKFVGGGRLRSGRMNSSTDATSAFKSTSSTTLSPPAALSSASTSRNCSSSGFTRCSNGCRLGNGKRGHPQPPFGNLF
nr:hypothetical protein Iba_chr04dCG14760 [Ipomoea batatas]